MKNKKLFVFTFLASQLVSLHAADSGTQKITIGLISTTSAEDAKARWKPLLDEMAAETKMDVKVIASTNYGDIVNGLKNNTIQVAWLGNNTALDAVIDGKAVIFAKMQHKNGTAGYNSVLITPKNSAITSMGDIVGKAGLYSYADGDPKSTSGHLIPDYYVFAKHNLDPKTQFKKMVVGSHQKNFTMVANGEVDIGTNNTQDLDRFKKESPDQFAKVRIFWTSPLIPSDPLLYRTDMSADVKAKVEEFFYGYGKKKPEQLEVLDKINGLSGFQRSSNAQLEVIARLDLYNRQRAVANDASLTPEQKQKALDEANSRIKKLETAMNLNKS